jgi:multidrug efflux pump subunit AcrB
MNVSAWSIRNPVPAILLFALLTACGLLAFSRLAVQTFPDMDLPMVTISASLEGAAPDLLETEVARKIEDRLATLSRLDHIATTITDGQVSITVSFALEKDGQEALSEVRNAVDSARADLPAEMADPQVSKSSVQGTAVAAYVISSDRMDESALSWFVDNTLTKALLKASGVGEVARLGGVDREVHVDLDPALMTSLGVSAYDVSAALKSVQVNLSGGRAEIGGRKQTIRLLGAVASADEIGALAIPVKNGLSVRLDQVATVTDTVADRSSLAYLDGKPVVAVEIMRSNGFSDTGVAKEIGTAIAAFQAAHADVRIAPAYTTVTPIEDNYSSSMQMLYEGALLAVVVVWLFLRDWRATVVSAVALPLSIIPTFLVIYLAGFSLNTISLLALSLVVGILVDDAIVEVENIARHIRMGKTPFRAAMEAADEIGLAVIATTFTLVAVFLPTAFMSGVPGLIFREFGVTAAVAVVASLLVARLLTPMMAAYFMAPHAAETRDGVVMTAYLRLVRACLTHRGLTTLGLIVFLAASAAAIPFLKAGFFPAPDNGQVTVSLTLPPGSEIAVTAAAAEQAAEILRRVKGVTQVFAAVGSATSGGGLGSSQSSEVTAATLTADLVPIDKRERSQTAIEADIRSALAAVPGVRIAVGAGANGTELQLTLASDNADHLAVAAAQVLDDVRSIKGIGNVTSSASLQAPEIQIVPDFQRAAAMGVTSEDIARVVRIATSGDYSSSLAKLNLPDRQIPIRVRLRTEVRNSLDALSQLRVTGNSGAVALGSIADIRIGGSAAEIRRLDRSRNVTLTVELNGRILGDVMEEIRALPAVRNLPADVHLVEQGELERMSELFENFAIAMGIGIFCIYGVLVLLFHDFLQPVSILMALPLSLGGALGPLVVTGTSFSMPAVIGLLMLMGVVTKNSILLVEYAIMARHRGMDRVAALIDACHKRARPIVMTTIAMGAGMLPVALSLGGGDSSFREPMAIVVIGGIVTSTFLSLLVIPVIFTFVDDAERFLFRNARKGSAGEAGGAGSGIGAGAHAGWSGRH